MAVEAGGRGLVDSSEQVPCDLASGGVPWKPVLVVVASSS